MMSDDFSARRPVCVIVILTVLAIGLESYIIYGSGGAVAQGLSSLIGRLAFLAVPLSLLAVLCGRIFSKEGLFWKGVWSLLGAFNLLFVQVMLMGHLARWKAEGEIKKYVSEIIAPSMRSYRESNGSYPSTLNEVVLGGADEFRYKPALHYSANEYLLVFFLPGSAIYIYRGSDASWHLTQPWGTSSLCPNCANGQRDSEYMQVPATSE